MQVTSCCGCCSLRAGTIIIGIIQIIFPIILLVLNLAMMQMNASTTQILYIVGLWIQICIASLLLVGVSKRNIYMMLPWLILDGIGAVLWLISYIAMTIVFFLDYFVAQGVVCLVGGSIGLLIYVYLWLVVYSHFQQLRSDKMNSRIDVPREICRNDMPGMRC